MRQYVGGGYVGEVLQQPVQKEQPAPQKFCRKCFLAEMKRQGITEETYRAMLERIENMDPELRCSKEVYEARITACKKCEYLVEAMCGVCGCFVESRAAVKANSCPAEQKRWEAIE